MSMSRQVASLRRTSSISRDVDHATANVINSVHSLRYAPNALSADRSQQLPELVLREARLLDDLLQEPTRQLLAVYRNDGRAFGLRMSVERVRSLLVVKEEPRTFKRSDNFLRPGAG